MTRAARMRRRFSGWRNSLRKKESSVQWSNGQFSLRSYLHPRNSPQSSRNVGSEEFGKLMDGCISGNVRGLCVNRRGLTPSTASKLFSRRPWLGKSRSVPVRPARSQSPRFLAGGDDRPLVHARFRGGSPGRRDARPCWLPCWLPRRCSATIHGPRSSSPPAKREAHEMRMD